MYDRRAIMNEAHRAYEFQIKAAIAYAAKWNPIFKKQKRPLYVPNQDKAGLWAACLKKAWANAKAAALAAQPPHIPTLAERAQALRDAIEAEEYRDRGYNIAYVSRLEDALIRLAA